MAFEVIMPKAGIDMTEGQIVKWLKEEGDTVTEGEIILEIMTDKTSMEIEAEASGVLLKILRHAGDMVPVTEVIAYIGQPGESLETLSDEEVPAPKPVAEQEPLASVADDEYHVAVIGGGPAGYFAAIRAAQLGAKVAIIEKRWYGGTCLNVGCIPTKTYLKNAEIIEAIEMGAARGINFASTKYSIDMNQVVKFKDGVVKRLTMGVEALLKSNGVDVFRGVAKINKNKDVVVDGNRIIKADKIILAGGSKVSRINIPGIDNPRILSSDELLSLKEVPETLTVIGGGVIGVEMALAMHAIGSKVTIVEMMDRIVPAIDSEASKVLADTLKKKGIKILNSVSIVGIEEAKNKLQVKLANGEVIESDKALLSIGRVPDLEGVGEIEFETERGKIKVDSFMETSVKGIYAPGDVNGIKMLAHVAFRMGEVAAENAVKGNHREVKLASAPSVVYTIPEVAMVGLTEEQAREKYDVRVGRFDFAANGRAMASGDNLGFVKVIADAKYGEILGVHIVGPTAAEMINQAAALMELEITVDEVVKVIYGHPTYSEALYEAFADVLGESIHIPKKKS
ncbi:MAG TPA: dihydrolipoyl dehydrogenase [Bacteroides graminisolvens]|jgi:dihydrolipoamide dehydrogenase|uniref:Dihydrolipoyl dehydrogenase n=2 Tax=root TaxID=1 RepID=A0A3D2SDB1_9BACE|nr:dihydrolipoyl dehydrogenase [Bacteroides graminisolvens]MCD8573128.1 dihydrolipoyl dehydrogenase [Bacteroides graminisolvens]HCK23844.1 dihydrolipoyl dehydrogenase [Bacteroides graminisolvens]